MFNYRNYYSNSSIYHNNGYTHNINQTGILQTNPRKNISYRTNINKTSPQQTNTNPHPPYSPHAQDATVTPDLTASKPNETRGLKDIFEIDQNKPLFEIFRSKHILRWPTNNLHHLFSIPRRNSRFLPIHFPGSSSS